MGPIAAKCVKSQPHKLTSKMLSPPHPDALLPSQTKRRHRTVAGGPILLQSNNKRRRLAFDTNQEQPADRDGAESSWKPEVDLTSFKACWNLSGQREVASQPDLFPCFGSAPTFAYDQLPAEANRDLAGDSNARHDYHLLGARFALLMNSLRSMGAINHGKQSDSPTAIEQHQISGLHSQSMLFAKPSSADAALAHQQAQRLLADSMTTSRPIPSLIHFNQSASDLCHQVGPLEGQLAKVDKSLQARLSGSALTRLYRDSPQCSGIPATQMSLYQPAAPGCSGTGQFDMAHLPFGVSCLVPNCQSGPTKHPSPCTSTSLSTSSSAASNANLIMQDRLA